MKSLKSRKNYASSESGATIVAKSQVTNSKAILKETSESYLIMPECNGDTLNSITIHLSEDVTVDSIILSHYEDFSSNLKQIRLYGTNDYPPENENMWINLTTTYPDQFDSIHLVTIALNPVTNVMIRYLRLDMVGPTHNDLYCTLTYIQVYGKGMH